MQSPLGERRFVRAQPIQDQLPTQVDDSELDGLCVGRASAPAYACSKTAIAMKTGGTGTFPAPVSRYMPSGSA